MIKDIVETRNLSKDSPNASMISPVPTTLCCGHSRQNSRPVVYLTRRIPQVGVDVLLKGCNVKQWDSEQAVPKGELINSVVGVHGILCMQSDKIDTVVLTAAGPQLRVVATLSQETEHIDVEECNRRGIKVITCPHQPTEILAELTIVLALLTIKESQTESETLGGLESQPPDLISNGPDGIYSMTWTKTRLNLSRFISEDQLAFQWTNGKPRNTKCFTWRKIAKKTFGIYGLTKLGHSVAKILNSVGVCDVLIADKDSLLDTATVNRSQMACTHVSFEELLEKSDVVCVCGPTGDKSRELFCADTFQKMKKHAILIVSENSESAVNYLELYEAVRDGQIRAAGFNDCNQDPVPLKTLLQGLANCTFLPQTQENVYDMRHKVSVLIAKKLVETFKNEAKQNSS